MPFFLLQTTEKRIFFPRAAAALQQPRTSDAAGMSTKKSALRGMFRVWGMDVGERGVERGEESIFLK